MATLLMSDDFVVRWTSKSFVCIFGHDPTGSDALDSLHPDDVTFALSVLEHHDIERSIYAGQVASQEVVPPSAELRIRSVGTGPDGSDEWITCMVRIDNLLHTDEVGALAVHIHRAIDPSGLAVAIDCVATAAPVQDALRAILGYMSEDGIRAVRGPTGVVWTDLDGVRHVVSLADEELWDPMFSAEAEAFADVDGPISIVPVDLMPPSLVRDRAEELGMRCLWALPIGGPGERLGAVLSWSAWMFAQELRPHMHFSIGCDVVRLALHEDRRRESMRRLSLLDPLTRVRNRAGLDDAFRSFERSGACSLGAVYVDLDDFKLVNDAYGHHVGDQVLAAVAERLQAAGRIDDVAARIGGDEFVLLCHDVDAESMASITARIEQVFRSPVLTDAGWLEVRASVGSSGVCDDEQLSELLRGADHALYRAKRRSKSLRRPAAESPSSRGA